MGEKIRIRKNRIEMHTTQHHPSTHLPRSKKNSIKMTKFFLTTFLQHINFKLSRNVLSGPDLIISLTCSSAAHQLVIRNPLYPRGKKMKSQLPGNSSLYFYYTNNPTKYESFTANQRSSSSHSSQKSGGTKQKNRRLGDYSA